MLVHAFVSTKEFLKISQSYSIIPLKQYFIAEKQVFFYQMLFGTHVDIIDPVIVPNVQRKLQCIYDQEFLQRPHMTSKLVSIQKLEIDGRHQREGDRRTVCLLDKLVSVCLVLPIKLEQKVSLIPNEVVHHLVGLLIQ